MPSPGALRAWPRPQWPLEDRRHGLMIC